jgi:adenosylmethionine---8-amino-7-oxononanoate aminotransferase
VERAFLHSHSFTGNPLACRAAVAMLEVLEKEAVIQQNQVRGDLIEQALSPLLRCAQVKDMRRLGMVFAFDCHDGPLLAKRIQIEAKQNGLLLRPIGATVYVMPPFLLTNEECLWLGTTLSNSVLSVVNEDA